MTKFRELVKEILKNKKRLMKEVAKDGLYENFGQDEVRELSDKFINISDYSHDMCAMRKRITMFDNWAMNYSPYDQ